MSQSAILYKPTGAKIYQFSPSKNTYNHPLVKEIVQQFHEQTREDNRQDLTEQSFIDSFIGTGKNKTQDISFHHFKVSVFFNAIAQQIAKQTGQNPQLFLNLSDSGSSSALICCGNLLVMYEMLPKVSNFGFTSLDKLIKEAQRIIEIAVMRIDQFF